MSWLTSLFTDSNTAPAAIGLLILVAVLIAVFGLLRLRQARSGMFLSGGRHRRQRLAVIDATAIDNRRRLVLVRRDDVEHLVLIGGNNDVVVEKGITADPAGTSADSTELPVQQSESKRPPIAEPEPEPTHRVETQAAHATGTATVATIAAVALAEPAPVNDDAIHATNTDEEVPFMEEELVRALDSAWPQPEPTPQPAVPEPQAPLPAAVKAPVAEPTDAQPAVSNAPAIPATSPSVIRDHVQPAATQPLEQSVPQPVDEPSLPEPMQDQRPEVATEPQPTPLEQPVQPAPRRKPTDTLDEEMSRLLSELEPNRD